MANYELITISKGTIKTVDSFIKNFNAIGANMKALSVSAYKFLTSEDKELKKDFQIRVKDELNMSPSTMTFLKTAGGLYLLDDRFADFAYTNVIYFKKAIEYFEEKNDIEISEESLTTLFKELALLHNSRLTEGFVESLVELSQKELKHLIDIYTSEEVEEVVEESTEDESNEESGDEVEEPTEEEVEEVNAHVVPVLDDDLQVILDVIAEVTDKTSKIELREKLEYIKNHVEGLMK